MKSLTTLLRAHILQNSKRLRTPSRPLEQQIKPIDPHIFQEVSLMTLIRFQGAFQKMAQNNKDKAISVVLSELKRLEVSDKQGSLILQASSELSTLFFTSPLNGSFKYYYDLDQTRFYSNKDGHLLDQNVSREAHRYFGDVLEL